MNRDAVRYDTAVVGLYGSKDQGKTATLVASAIHLVEVERMFDWSDVYGNLMIRDAEGYTFFRKRQELMVFLRDLISGEHRKVIVLIDEADRVFPARSWKDKLQTEIILGFWQSRKIEAYVLFTAHLGNTVDVQLELATNIMCGCKYDKSADTCIVTVINGDECDTYKYRLEHLSRVFDRYDSWDYVD